MALGFLPICMLAAAAQKPEVPLLAPIPGVFSATPICGAGHEHCAGKARLVLRTEYGDVELAEAEVFGGERFELSLEGAPVTQRQADQISVELALEGHVVLTVDAPPIREGCDLAGWRAPAPFVWDETNGGCILRGGPRVPSKLGPRCLRIELEAGDASDAIVGFVIPDDETPAGLCGFAHHPIVTPDFGVCRLDRRSWTIDLDQLKMKKDHFRIFVETLSGASIASEVNLAGSSESSGVVKVQAPARLCRIRGTVLDASGHPVLGARIRACALPTETEKFTVSDALGRFEFDRIAPCRVWLSVSDTRWRSRSLTGLFVEARPDSTEAVKLVVNRQSWIELDARALAPAPGSTALIALSDSREQESTSEPTCVLALDAESFSAPLRVPVTWGNTIRVSVIPVPAVGIVHHGALGPELFEARASTGTLTFPAGDKPGVTRFLRLNPR